MRTVEIFREAMGRGLLPATGGKTPHLTMAATLYARARRCPEGALVRVGPGVFALRVSGMRALLAAVDTLT